jgi:hypothetical protein
MHFMAYCVYLVAKGVQAFIDAMMVVFSSGYKGAAPVPAPRESSARDNRRRDPARLKYTSEVRFWEIICRIWFRTPASLDSPTGWPAYFLRA